MQRFIQTINVCDYVFAGNRYLAESAQKHQANTAIIPTSLETGKYALTPARNDQAFVLVWIGSRSTKKYIASILPEIEAAATDIPNLTLRIVADFSLNSTVLNIENISWSESTEASALASADVGLAPLPADNWTKGKCALKVLQYMAARLPVITTPTSANAEAIENGKSGYYAHDQRDWRRRIKQAYQDKAQLADMGEFAYEHVRKHYDISIVFNKIHPFLSKL